VNPVSNAELRTAQDVISDVRVNQSPNGVCYATAGEVTLPSNDIERMIQAIPRSMAGALTRKAFYFVPLTIGDGEKTLIAERFDPNLTDSAICHRNIDSGDSQCVFISTRLLDDRFSIAFELYINVGHAFVDKAGLSAEFGELVWNQAVSGVRGETSLDANEFRKLAMGDGTGRGGSEKAKSEYLAAAFSDSIAIYLLSLYLDVQYRDLREREYPLLAPAAMADRLKKIAALFPPNPDFQFNIFYRRKT
jgi:hypothetical protein